jgi:hypothetical protein
LSKGLGPFADFSLKPVPPASTSPRAVGGYVGGTGGPHLRTVELSPENFPPFAFFLKGFGLIPNLFRAQSLRPDVLEAEADAVRKILQHDDILSRLQKECRFGGEPEYLLCRRALRGASAHGIVGR